MVTDENLEPHIAAMHPDDECGLTAEDMQQLFKTLAPETPLEEPKSDSTESNDEVLDHVAKKARLAAEPSLEDRKGDDTESKAKVLDNGAKKFKRGEKSI